MADEAQERITGATKDAERREAEAAHEAPQVPTEEEAKAAEASAPASDETRESYEEMREKGAEQKGEGRIP